MLNKKRTIRETTSATASGFDDTEPTPLVFVDTYQNVLSRQVVAVAIKLRIGTNWYVHVYETQVKWEDVQDSYDFFYSTIDAQDWISTFKSSSAEFFLAREYCINRYPSLLFLEESEFMDRLYDNYFVLIDTGEQQRWFKDFAKGHHFQYDVRKLSISELGNELTFQLPVELSRSEENELRQFINSIELKTTAMISRYGTRIRGHPLVKELLEALKDKLT